MQRFIEKPGLPERGVKTVVMSDIYPALTQAIAMRGLNILNIKKDDSLPNPIAHHADLQLLHLGGENFIASSKCSALKNDILNINENAQVHLLNSNLGNHYPEDIALNFLIAHNFCIGRTDCASQLLLDTLDKMNIYPIQCNQGYARCSVALINEEAAITADILINRILLKLGYDVLLIPPGDIVLHGYDYGFIGGCCGKISKYELAFTGSLDYYKNGPTINNFLLKHGVKSVYLQNSKLVDIGGIIPITE